MNDQRGQRRTPLKVKLRIDHPQHGELLVTTRDISDSGLFVLIDDQQLLHIGECVQGQVQGLPMEAPLVQLEVVRAAPGGVGLRFRRD